jgi:YVTN family beta-propeller protein
VPGGEYPFGVAVQGSSTAYISSVRDREIDVVSLTGTPALTARIKVPGNPTKLILNKAGTRLYVATDNADAVEVINTQTNAVIASIPTIAPPGLVARAEDYRGVDPNSLALSPDQNTLYVTNGGNNDIAVIALNTASPHVIGLIPAGDLPNAVSVSADGKWFYAVNGRSTPGPDTGYGQTSGFNAAQTAGYLASNQYILQLSKAGFLAAPVPTGAALATDTLKTLSDDHLLDAPNPLAQQTMAFLHQHIKHIIYIIRENRTYDQMLGDLGKGNGDPSLAMFGKTDAPNAHNLALNFVDLDNFYDVGEVSGNGWPWSTSARESDMGAKNLAVNYANRGLTYDWEGTNRNVNVAQATLQQRIAADPLVEVAPDVANILPGTGNIAAPDSPTGIPQQGYLWDSAFRAGLSVRNYGFFIDEARYTLPLSFGGIPELTSPATTGTQVSYSANPTLAPVTDIYFRGFDTAFPDFYREAEWQREFTSYVTNNNLPNLELVRFMHDHLGSFSTAIAGVNTPDIQVADNDYAVGELISAVAHSPYASNTLIFVIEDDAQDGADHVDAHRSEAFIVGPYVKHGAIVSTHYSTVNFLATIEDILGIDHLSVHDAYQQPMYDVFDINQKTWTYNATVPAPLSATTLPVSTQAVNVGTWRQLHPAAYWAAMTHGYNWSKEDDVPTNQFNIVLWRGLEPGKPYPLKRSGINYDKVARTASAQ